MNWRSGCLTALLLLPILAHAGESGVMLKADVMRAEPYGDAKTVTKLKKGDKVDILQKEGGWYEVKKKKKQGWVRMLSLRKGEARKGSDDAAGLLSVASGRAGTGQVVATTGIRGLNEEELKAARFNEDEIKLAESYGASKEQAQSFAAQGGLTSRRFDYLPEVK